MQTINTQTVTIDIRKRSLSTNFVEKENTQNYIPQFVQGDTNILEAVIKDGGVDADLSDVGTVVGNFKRKDGVKISRSATVSGNVVTYTLGNEEMVKSGIGELELQFYNADDTERISTLRFKVNVMAEIGVGLEGEDGPTLVQELVFNGQYAKQAADSAITNWLPPVASYSAVTSIPSPKLGDTVQTNDTGYVYRYENGSWKNTQQYGATALANVNTQLSEKATKLELDEGLLTKVNLQNSDVTVSIPSDFATLQQAIDEMSIYRTKQGKTINLLIESGHRPGRGVKVENGDYKHFIISSVDSEVILADDYYGHFIEARNANAPKLNCLINANYKGWAGVWLDDQSTGFISSGCGVKNTPDRALYVNKASTVWAEGSIFTGGTVQALWVSRVSTAFVDNADFSYGGSANASGEEPVSIHISRQSRVYGLGIKVLNSLGTAVKCQRGSIFSAVNGDFSGAKENGVQITGGSMAYLEGSKIENTGLIGLISQGACNVHATFTSIKGKVGNTSNGVLCENGSLLDIDKAVVSGFGGFNIIANRAGTINASSTTISGSGNHGVYAEQGSTVNLRSASVKNSGAKDLAILRGSFITAHDCTTTNGVGSPAVGDTNVTTFNALQSSQGVIWK